MIWTRIGCIGGACAVALAATSFESAAQPAPATAPTTAPAPATGPATQPIGRGWFGDEAGPADLFPELVADAGIRAVTPRTVFTAIASDQVPTKLPRMSIVAWPFTERSLKAYDGGNRDWRLLVPDERKIKIAAVDARRKGAALCIDVEQLPLSERLATDADIDEAVRLVARMIGWAREQAPEIRVFLYATMPQTDRNAPLARFIARTVPPTDPKYAQWRDALPKIEADVSAWRNANARLRRGEGRAVGLADLVDGVCPSLYVAGDPTTRELSIFVRAHLDEARKYGKPVYPFVWTRLLDRAEPIALDRWVQLMRDVCTYGDGMVLWDEPNRRIDIGSTLRMRIAVVMSERRGVISDRELYDALKDDYGGHPELQQLLAMPPAEPPVR